MYSIVGVMDKVSSIGKVCRPCWFTLKGSIDNREYAIGKILSHSAFSFDWNFQLSDIHDKH